MKAVVMTETGGPEVLAVREVDEPCITSPDQVKVRLHGAGINPIDTKLRARGVFHGNVLPAILGCDGAGEVLECGAAVNGHSVGDRVWFCHGGLGAEPGNYAQYAVLPAALVRPAPRSLDLLTAGAGPLVLTTAYEALFDRGRLEKGQTVLIQAGAGGVGHVAIQLARIAGARVCTTASGADKVAFVRGLGAEYVIDHRAGDFVEGVSDWTGGRGVDLVLDCVGGETFQRSIAATAHYGTMVTLLEPATDTDWKEARNRNLRIAFELMLTPMLNDMPQARAHQCDILDRCATWIDQGELSLQISRAFALAEAPAAHELIGGGRVLGKLVLDTH